MDIDRYFSRIGYNGPREPTAAVLRDLQRAHLMSVPFENLDIHLGRPIRLESDALFDKVVTRRRGGFCYELNGLFGQLLEALGYQVVLLTASSWNDDGSYSRDYDHLTLEVHAPDAPEIPWLVDVGWGNGPLEPLRMDDLDEQVQGPRAFRVRTDDDFGFLYERGPDGAWFMHYRYRRQPQVYSAFFEMCRYHQTSPDSMFTQKRLCSLYTPDGRITLTELKLIRSDHQGGRDEQLLPDEAAAHQALRAYFDVDLSL